MSSGTWYKDNYQTGFDEDMVVVSEGHIDKEIIIEGEPTPYKNHIRQHTIKFLMITLNKVKHLQLRYWTNVKTSK